MEGTNRPWIIEFSRRLREAGTGGRLAVLRDAEKAFAALGDTELRRERVAASIHEVDPELERWLVQRLEPPEASEQRRHQAFFDHLHGVRLAIQGGAELEAGLAIIEDALSHLFRFEAVEDWSQMQHNLAEALVRREAGMRADNLERAVTAYRAALPGRRGPQRVDTLFGLAQALKQRENGRRADNLQDGRKALDEAERLLARTRDEPRRTRLMLERADFLARDGDFEEAHALVRRALLRDTDEQLRWQVLDREAAVLTAWANEAPERRAEAIAKNHMLLRTDHTKESAKRLFVGRSRLRSLGEPIMAVTPEVLGHEDIHWWIDELGEGPLAPALLDALDLRVRREEREAFALPSGRALVRREAELGPLLLRLAIERDRAGDAHSAVAYLAHLGAWPLRRALRWVDFSASPSVAPLCFSRVLEDRLAEILIWAPLLDESGHHPSPPAKDAAERVRRYLDGVTDHAFLSPDDLTVLFGMPPDDRAAAAAQIAHGIESGLVAKIAQIGESARPLHNSLVLPPPVPVARFAASLPNGQAWVLFANMHTDLALGAVWRGADGCLCARMAWGQLPHEAPPEGSEGFPLLDALKQVVAALREACVERIGVVCRGVYARSAAIELAPLSATGARIVHLPGVDRVELPPLSRARAGQVLVLLDPDPDAQLPCIKAVSATLRDVGFTIHHDGAMLREETVKVLEHARGLVLAGHGEAAMGPLGPTIGAYPAGWLDQLPLRASEWSLCMACSAGDSGRVDDLTWDRDDPAGAAEQLLLAGSRSAADCLSPVPEVLAALVLEEFGVRTAAGEEPERAFATTVQAFRAFWASLSEPLAEAIVAGAPVNASGLSAWLVERLDAERRRRLQRDLRGLPPQGLFMSLGPRPPASLSAGGDCPRDIAWARDVAGQMLAPFVRPQTWAAFRWMARR